MTEICAIGNAIVDVIAKTTDAELTRHDIPKGTMRLIDEETAKRLLEEMKDTTTSSGGSAANTCAGIASFGGQATFLGKTRQDTLGEAFAHDMRAQGVMCPVTPDHDGPATACSYILVTPDGERTMNTFLGAAQNLYAKDIEQNADTIKRADYVYLEGYLWDPPHAKDAFRTAMAIAKDAETKVAFTLSDPFCVTRYREEFLALITSRKIDLLFANEHELKALYATDDFEHAVTQLTKQGISAAITRSAKGALMISQGTPPITVAANPVLKVVDATGAGDQFAAGVLFGLTHGKDMKAAGHLGALAASEVISHMGARPVVSLKSLAAQYELV